MTNDPHDELATTVTGRDFFESALAFERASEHAPAGAKHPGVDLADDPRAAEELRLLRVKVRALGRERALSCMGITSASPGEGKSTLTLGLAHAFAQEGAKVLIVEADLRRPALGRYLALGPAEGLGEFLATSGGTVPVRRIEPHAFDLLSAGRLKSPRADLLGGPRMDALLKVARGVYDFIIVDCPPLLPVADSLVLQDLVDGFLLVVRARHSPRETILKAVSRLKPDRLRGIVFNDHREILSRYYGYAYDGYGGYN